MSRHGTPRTLAAVPVRGAGREPALVSVVIPCHDYARYLPTAVLSAVRQEGVRVQVIVVDDVSTDDSVAVARGLAERFACVEVLEQDTRQGPVGTFNAGLALARGEFLVRLDADDALTTGALARALGAFRALPRVGLVYGHPLHFVGDGVPWEGHLTARGSRGGRRGRIAVWDGREWLARRCRDGFNVITSPEAVLRMSAVRRVGGHRELAHTHDMEWWLRLAVVSDVAYLRGVDQAWHRDHPASLSAREVDELVDLRERWAAFRTLFASPPGSQLARAAAYRERARRALLAEALRRARRDAVRGRERSDAWTALLAELSVDQPERRRGRAAVGVHRGPGAAFARRARVNGESVRERMAWEVRRRRWARRGVY